MKIAVVGANGKAGRHLVQEAKARGLDVTAIVRQADQSGADHVIQKDLFDLTASDLAGFDVVINAIGVWATQDLPQHTTALMKLCDLLKASSTRLLVVGGAGSLYVDATHQAQVMDGPDFPAFLLPLAKAMGDGLAALRLRSDVKWTYVSPPLDFQAEGPRTGKYQWAGETLTLNAQGVSALSYADYAVALLDLVEKPQFVGQRVSVLGC